MQPTHAVMSAQEAMLRGPVEHGLYFDPVGIDDAPGHVAEPDQLCAARVQLARDDRADAAEPLHHHALPRQDLEGRWPEKGSSGRPRRSCRHDG